MVVFCPSCGSRISVEPESPGGSVECPRCHSTFATAGLKSAEDAPPPKRFRPKKTGGSKTAVVLIALAVLLVLGGGTVGALYFAGVIGNRTTTWRDPLRPPQWIEYSNAEGRFTVLFPGTPTRDEVKSRSGKVQAVSFSAATPSAAFSVAIQDLDSKQTPEQVIEQSRAELAAGKLGKLLSEKDVTAGTYKGKEFVVETPTHGTWNMRFIAAGRRLYKVMAVGMSKPPDAKDVAKFFESFRING